ncbi:DUF916 domain-containing protein [Vagococcus xieshaowenii]|uniref:DUF916 and DUF3324 domain-containing protein n=1 Tax=Vagococcus xieshaowenii TaxID=2562451 RepID=A0AAJ5JMI5_9ENTE|nr:DUF916 domain-containing protein [Vagococcus xieshaowenii]QCA28053.1 DUF916 and DUF3324 domain-containing protein [Vagococcus xieshaowenii]TFZ42091.1 DUF916 and DUF3324 domain-containing protein [Vagococcus xieshaowenii]
MRKQLAIIVSIFFISMIGGLIVTPVNAEEQPAFEYTVTPIFPENQTDKTLGYFDLLVQPGSKQQVMVEVSNSSKEEKKIKITPTTSGTTTSGTIDYSGKSLPHTDDLIASFSDITSQAQIVTLKANEKKKVGFEIQVPDKEFSGVILGGFYAQEVLKESNNESKKDGLQIENRFAIIIGCVLKNSDQAVEQAFSLQPVTVDNYGGYFSLNIPLVNEVARIMSDYQLDGSILNDKKEVIQTIDASSFSMAPQSIYNLPVQVDAQTFKPGKYQLKLTVSTKDKKNDWQLSSDFKIDAKKRQEVMKESIDTPAWYETNAVLYGIIAILIVIVVVIAISKKRK